MSELDPETHHQHDERMAHDAAYQEAINAVMALNLGHDVPVIMTALSEALAARGLGQPPYDWLNAVAAEISLGNRYVVGTRSVYDAEAAERRHEYGEG
jgi:4-diphosphocytidyl-2C-methyl-D-erythritol kinase